MERVGLMSKIEDVARALCIRAIRIARRWDTDPAKVEEMISSGEAVEYSWRDYIDEARTAIEAMREPTAEMGDRFMSGQTYVEWVKDVTDKDEWYGDFGDFKAGWGAAIDAALAEPA